MSGPWFAMAANVHADARVRKARARAVWPWVLCRLKDGGGVASDDDLDPWRASDDLDGDVSEARAGEVLAALRSVGLLVPASGGGWTTPNWARYQGDPTASDRKRAQRARELTSRSVTDVTRDKRDVTDVTDVTIQDRTGQDRTGHQVTPSRMRAHAHATDGGREGMAELVELVLDAYRVDARHPRPIMLDGGSAAKLFALVDRHGPAKVRAALAECGGAERPVAMVAAKLDALPNARSRVASPHKNADQSAPCGPVGIKPGEVDF